MAIDLPNELWYRIFLFVDDYDLPILEKVNKLFRSVVNDTWLRFLIQNENQLRVTGKLKKRPERSFLVIKNILKGPTQTNLLALLQRGAYVDVLMYNMYNIGTLLSKKQTTKRLDKMLLLRPGLERLESLFLVSRRIAPSLHPNITKLENQLKRHHAKRKISNIDHRKKLDENMPTSKLLAPLQVVVRRNVVQKELRRKLRERKEPLVLLAQGILTEIQVIPLVCPAVKPKIDFYEGISGRKCVYST